LFEAKPNSNARTIGDADAQFIVAIPRRQMDTEAPAKAFHRWLSEESKHGENPRIPCVAPSVPVPMQTQLQNVQTSAADVSPL
jgi:hypothetical protein